MRCLRDLSLSLLSVAFVDLGFYQDRKTCSNLRFEYRGDLLMGIMSIVELSRFIPSRIFDLQINQSLLINQLELLIEQFSQSPNWILI
jgi:hypothetical protein